MTSRQLKRNQNSSKQSPIKRQKSKPDFDDTDGGANSKYTPENNPRINARNGYKDSVVPKNLFTGEVLNSVDVSRNETNNDIELVNTKSNGTVKSETVLPMDMTSDSDSVDYCLKPEVKNRNVCQGQIHGKFSAGAYKGRFPMKCKKGHNVSQTQSSSIPCSNKMSNWYGVDSDSHFKRHVGSLKQKISARQICVRRSCNRMRGVKKSDLETDDLDMDIIHPIGVHTDVQDSTREHNDVPMDYTVTKIPLQKSPGAIGCMMRAISPRTDTSPLYIKHAQATDDPVLGDRFGASFETKRIDGYYRHIIRHVDVNGVADNMKLNDGDELVLINEGFVPELDHKTILQLFSGVPVDQHTRFTLVLRRPLKDEKWEWVTTSAILVPELEKPPEVRELRLDRDKGNTKLFEHWYRIQIDGTQLFLIISDGEIRVQVASGDLKDYNICVRSKCVVNPLSGDISYYACLFGVHHEEISKNNYLHVNGTGEIGLDREPQWFGYGRKGRKMIFKVQELQKYIGCLVYEESYGTKGHLCIQDDEYDDFNANSIETSYDHPDTGNGYWSRPSSQRSSASEPLSLGLSRTSDTSRSSLSGSNNGSFDDSGYSGYGGGTQCDRPRPFESPISDSGSSQYSSVNSGACRTPNTPMADLSLFTTKRCLENNYK